MLDGNQSVNTIGKFEVNAFNDSRNLSKAANEATGNTVDDLAEDNALDHFKNNSNQKDIENYQ